MLLFLLSLIVSEIRFNIFQILSERFEYKTKCTETLVGTHTVQYEVYTHYYARPLPLLQAVECLTYLQLIL